MAALLALSVGAVVGAVAVLGMPFSCFMAAMTLCSFSVGYINIPTHTNLLTKHAEGGDYFACQLSESTSYGGVLSNYITAGLSNQIEHHVFPNAPFCALPLLRPYVKQYAEEQGEPYHYFASFWTCLVSWYKQVLFLSRDPAAAATAAAAAAAKAPKTARRAGETHDTSSDSDTSSDGAPEELPHSKGALPQQRRPEGSVPDVGTTRTLNEYRVDGTFQLSSSKLKCA